MIPALLPAAGRSERMGRPKLSLPWGDTTVLGSLLRSFASAGTSPIVVVVREGDRGTVREARRHGALVVTNPEPERGMLSSVIAGLRFLESEHSPRPRSAFVCPADLPAIATETIRALASLELGAAELAVPTFEGRTGHPLRLGESLVQEVYDLDLRVGLRQIRDRHPDAIRRIPVEDPGILRDVDTPVEYEALLALVSLEPDEPARH